MIAKTGEVKGLDFGLAKETAAEPASSARVPIRIACSIHRGVSRIAPGDSRSGDAEMLLAMRSRLTELFVRAAMTEKSNAVLGKVWKCYIPENVVGVADNRVRIELVGALRSVNRPSSDGPILRILCNESLHVAMTIVSMPSFETRTDVEEPSRFDLIGQPGAKSGKVRFDRSHESWIKYSSARLPFLPGSSTA
jgi:hypothetical protein